MGRDCSIYASEIAGSTHLLFLHPSTSLVVSSLSSSLCLESATFRAFNHSMPSVQGTEAATRATESIIVRLTAVFQIERRLAYASGEVANARRLAAPAVTTALLEMPGICLGTSLMIVLTVMVWPSEIATALYCQLDRNLLNRPYPPSW